MRPTVELKRVPTRADFYAVKDRAEAECECGPEAELMKGEAGRLLCVPCACREALNAVVERADEL